MNNNLKLTIELAVADADMCFGVKRWLLELLAHPYFLEVVELTLPAGLGDGRKYEMEPRLEHMAG